MGKSKENKFKNIELKSNEINEVIGIIPHWITRWGLSIILFVVIVFLIGSWYFKYPEILSLKIIITRSEVNYSSRQEYKFYGKVEIEEKDWPRITIGMKVNVKLNGYPFQQFGVIQGKITRKVDQTGSKFSVIVALVSGLETSYKKQISFYKGMSGQAEILIGETRLFEKIIYPLKRIFNN